MQTLTLILIARMIYAVLTNDVSVLVNPIEFVSFMSYACLIAVANSARSLTYTYQ